MTIHPAAARGFDKAPDRYERGRPSYPDDAVAWIVEGLRLAPGKRVTDVAAGTGKFTRLLRASGATVLAVEPVAGMARELTRHAPVVRGTVEALPLVDSSVDAVTVAQAFHWFRADEALAEIRRVLLPDGALCILWNVRDLEDPLQAAVDEIVNRYRGDTPSHRSGRWRDAFEGTALEERRFAYEHELDADELVDRVASTSFIAELPDDVRAGVLNEIGSLTPAGRFAMPYVTAVYVAQPNRR